MEKTYNSINFELMGSIYFTRILFILISLVLVCAAYFLLRNRITSFLNFLIPRYHSINIRSDDPYHKSIFDERKIQSDIDIIKKSIIKFIFLVFIIISFSLVFSLLFSDSSSSDNSSEKIDQIQFGPFGDLFNGILAPLLTFSSFVFLLLTVIMQNVQMRATLNELQLSRLEMSSSTSALEAQAKNLNLQKFDNIFFSLVENYKILMKELREEDFYDQNGNKIKEPYDLYVSKKFRKINIQENNKELNSFWGDSKDAFSSIFLMNYQILKYIDENIGAVISNIEAKRYIRVLRAVTPKEIIFLIYANGGSIKREKYRKLIEKFAFLEHIIFDKMDVKKFKLISKNYNINAFGDCELLRNYLSSIIIENIVPHPAFDGLKHFFENISNSSLKKEDKEVLIKMFRTELSNFRDYYAEVIGGGTDKLISGWLGSNENFMNLCRGKFFLSTDANESINEHVKRIKEKLSLEYKKYSIHEDPN